MHLLNGNAPPQSENYVIVIRRVYDDSCSLCLWDIFWATCLVVALLAAFVTSYERERSARFRLDVHGNLRARVGAFTRENNRLGSELVGFFIDETSFNNFERNG
ncbi:hypothetical protein BU15DRAFT_68317 [Melanogaster broomeanus]|nr:hypothetical protein BU15DRAFT_68317 [Melanogaster broomeanus]